MNRAPGIGGEPPPAHASPCTSMRASALAPAHRDHRCVQRVAAASCPSPQARAPRLRVQRMQGRAISRRRGALWHTSRAMASVPPSIGCWSSMISAGAVWWRLIAQCCPAAIVGCRCSRADCRRPVNWTRAAASACAATSMKTCSCWSTRILAGACEARQRKAGCVAPARTRAARRLAGTLGRIWPPGAAMPRLARSDRRSRAMARRGGSVLTEAERCARR
jgi:hypothetical protein